MSRGLAAFAVTIALVAGCSSKSTGSKHTTTTVRPTAAVGATLQRLLLTDLPAGYTMEPDAKANTGPADFEMAVRSENSADGRDLLTRTKYRDGYQRVWSTPGALIVEYVYEFTEAAGADEYLKARVARASDTTPISGQARLVPTPFDVPGVPGATGLLTTRPGYASAGVLFARANYVVLLAVDNNSDADPRDRARALATQAYGKLPG